MTRFLTCIVLLGPVLGVGCTGFSKIGERDTGGAGDDSAGEGGTAQSGGTAGTSTSGSAGRNGGTGNVSAGSGGQARGGTSGAGAPGSGGNGASSGVAGVANAGGSAGSTPACDDASDCVLHDIACLECPGGAPACPSFSCVGGHCTTSFPTCAGECNGDEDCPVSLAPCQPCPDGSNACPWAHCVDGQCQAGIDTCENTSPCEGKSCGDACTLCPNGLPCPAIPSAQMFCDETLTCQLNVPECKKQVCETHDDCNMTDDCPQCPGITGCALRECVDGACVLDCSDPPTDPCGGCENDQICIYQVGGPGPSAGLLCADQVVCDAPGACACIVGQGTCTYTDGVVVDTMMCVCDNGLE